MRIPASMLVAAHVHLDQPVDVREEDWRIIIEPIRQPLSYDFTSLIAGITDVNRYEPFQTGIPPSQEAW